MLRSRYARSLLAAAALAVPIDAAPGQDVWLVPMLAPAVPEPPELPVLALLAAGLALGLARGSSGVRRPVRRRRG